MHRCLNPTLRDITSAQAVKDLAEVATFGLVVGGAAMVIHAAKDKEREAELEALKAQARANNLPVPG